MLRLHIFRVALGIPFDATPVAAGTLLVRHANRLAPRLRSLLPLVAPMFHAETAQTREASEIAPRFRRAQTERVLVELLETVDQRPTVVVVDDRRLADDASLSALDALAWASLPWLVISTSRSTNETEGRSTERIDLRALEHDAMRTIAVHLAERTPLLPAAIDLAIERANGNPFYLAELVRTASEFEEGRISESIEQLVAARIDGIGARLRHALGLLSVGGEMGDIETAATALDVPNEVASSVLADLGEFVELDTGLRYRFRSQIHRDVAYGMVSFRSKRRAHHRLADYLETQGSRSPVELVAYHRFHAGDYGRAYDALRVAARDAVQKQAVQEAAAHYRRALAAAAMVRNAGPDERGQLFLELAEVLELGGEVGQADAAYARASRLIPSSPLMFKRRAAIRELQGRYVPAIKLIHRGLRTLETLSAGAERDRSEAELLNLLAGVRFRQGNLVACAEVATRAAASARRANDAAALGQAYYLLGHSKGLSGDSQGRENLERALGLLESAGDLVRLANVLNNLGVAAYYAGDIDEAIAFYERSRDTRERAGDVIGAATQQNNIGEALSDIDELDEAESLFRKARATWRAARYAIGIAIATGNLGRLATRRASFHEADKLLRDALARFAELGAQDFVLQTQIRIAENHLAAENPEASLEAIAAAGPAQLASANTELHLVHGRALAALGRVDEARQKLLTAEHAARAVSAEAELAAIAAELDRLT